MEEFITFKAQSYRRNNCCENIRGWKGYLYRKNSQEKWERIQGRQRYGSLLYTTDGEKSTERSTYKVQNAAGLHMCYHTPPGLDLFIYKMLNVHLDIEYLHCCRILWGPEMKISRVTQFSAFLRQMDQYKTVNACTRLSIRQCQCLWSCVCEYMGFW